MSNFYEADGVVAGEYEDDDGASRLYVADDNFSRFRLTFLVPNDGTLHVGIDAAWCDKHPGQLANFTHDERGGSWLEPDDVLSMSDEGLFTVMRRIPGASFVEFRTGFTLQLPREYVEPVRLAITKAREVAALNAKGKP